MKFFNWIAPFRALQVNVDENENILENIGYVNVRVEKEKKNMQNEKTLLRKATEQIQDLNIAEAKSNTNYAGKEKLIEKSPNAQAPFELLYDISSLTKNDIEKDQCPGKLQKLNRWADLYKTDKSCDSPVSTICDIVNEYIPEQEQSFLHLLLEKHDFVKKNSVIPLLIGCVAVGAVSIASVIMIKTYMKNKFIICK